MGFLFLSLFFFVGAVSATNHTVTPSDSIQSKIDGASSGDTLNLAAGTYNQYNIKVNKSLTISGPTTTGTPSAVIDAQNRGRVFNITKGANVILKYLTITNGNTTKDLSSITKDKSSLEGGGIHNQGNCTIVGCKINTNTAYDGGGIYNNGTCTMTGSNINTNTVISEGGGIYNNGTFTVTGSNINNNTAYNGAGIYNTGTFTVTGSNINNNNADYGGGIYNKCNCTLTGSNINNNTAIGYGGGIYIYAGICTMNGCNINNNTAIRGGGIYSFDTSTMTGSNIKSNTATSSGGGIYNYGTCTVSKSNITSNTATNSGGIYNIGTCTVTSSSINCNTATNGVGGGIYNYYGTCTVTGSNINNNTATSDGGGIYNYYNTFTVTDSSINNNTADYGGGISNYDGTCTVTGSSIKSNTADYGGGIYIFDGTFSVTGSSIKSNTAIYGGGIYNGGTCTVTGSDINYNNAVNGGGIFNEGTCTVTGCDFESNKATNEGNAIYNDNSDTYTEILHYNRFHDTKIGYEIYCASGNVDATFNWWGSDSDPSSQVYGDVDVTPWLVYNPAPTVTAVDPASNAVNVLPNKVIQVTFSQPIKIGTGWIELINSSGTSIPITTSINGYVLTISHTALLNGKYTLVLHTGSLTNLAGNNINAYTTSFTVDTPPTITTTNPANNAVNVALNKVITVTFSEPVKAGNMWIELYNVVGKKSLIPITTSISGNVLTINHAALLATGTKYTLSLHTGSIYDLTGNSLAGVSRYFTTSTDGTAPTITSTDPTNNAVNVPRNKVITVTFSEPVKAGNMWIELYNAVGTKTLIPITTSISGNVLTINHASLLLTGTKYVLAFHTGSITDAAGNPVASAVRYFTTGTI